MHHTCSVTSVGAVRTAPLQVVVEAVQRAEERRERHHLRRLVEALARGDAVERRIPPVERLLVAERRALAVAPLVLARRIPQPGAAALRKVLHDRLHQEHARRRPALLHAPLVRAEPPQQMAQIVLVPRRQRLAAHRTTSVLGILARHVVVPRARWRSPDRRRRSPRRCARRTSGPARCTAPAPSPSRRGARRDSSRRAKSCR